MKNRITDLFEIEYPIIQAGMVWCSGWKLASAVSNAGGLGLIGSGSMYPDILRIHIQKCKKATSNPFGVNIPLLYPDIEDHIQTILEEGVKIVFTSAGNPSIWTPILKNEGIKVIHVVSSTRFAIKCEDIGVHGIVAEGFEAGGHNGREETTSMCLIPMVKESTHLPLIAAGGIASGKSMLAAMALGADGVQVGTRFASAFESSAHQNFKNKIIDLKEGETFLSLKRIAPVRLIKNVFFDEIKNAEDTGAEIEELKKILGHGRSRKGIFEGDLEQGELEIGQIGAMVQKNMTAEEILNDLWKDYIVTRKKLCKDI